MTHFLTIQDDLRASNSKALKYVSRIKTVVSNNITIKSVD